MLSHLPWIIGNWYLPHRYQFAQVAWNFWHCGPGCEHLCKQQSENGAKTEVRLSWAFFRLEPRAYMFWTPQESERSIKTNVTTKFFPTSESFDWLRKFVSSFVSSWGKMAPKLKRDFPAFFCFRSCNYVSSNTIEVSRHQQMKSNFMFRYFWHHLTKVEKFVSRYHGEGPKTERSKRHFFVHIPESFYLAPSDRAVSIQDIDFQTFPGSFRNK